MAQGLARYALAFHRRPRVAARARLRQLVDLSADARLPRLNAAARRSRRGDRGVDARVARVHAHVSRLCVVAVVFAEFSRVADDHGGTARQR